MNELEYRRAATTADAVELLAHGSALGGGTNLVDLMRQGIEHPSRLVDVSRLARSIDELPDGGVRIGAGAKNSAIAAHRRVRERYPMLASAILHGASGQIRNMATAAGNLMQRTRCNYFYDSAARCNKRVPGAGCDALVGINRMHAILGTSERCIATHPSDMCVALAALEPIVRVTSARGDRAIAFGDLHVVPGDMPERETSLGADELITAIDLPAAPAGRQLYRKVRDRASYAFALVSIAASLSLDADGAIREVRIALGGVATIPWRARAAEAILQGQPLTEARLRQAAEVELAPAVSHGQNHFKIELAKRVIVSALTELAGATR